MPITTARSPLKEVMTLFSRSDGTERRANLTISAMLF
jgi:hypothetical protein